MTYTCFCPNGGGRYWYEQANDDGVWSVQCLACSVKTQGTSFDMAVVTAKELCSRVGLDKKPSVMTAEQFWSGLVGRRVRIDTLRADDPSYYGKVEVICDGWARLVDEWQWKYVNLAYAVSIYVLKEGER